MLTHCGLVTLYGDIDLSQHWLRQWLVATWHQAITWSNVDFSLSSDVLRLSPESNFTANPHPPILYNEFESSSFNMMTSSNGNIFRVTGPLCGEFTGAGEFPAQRPVTRSFGDFFDLRPNKLLSKHWWGWWFETLSHPLWRHCNEISATSPRCQCLNKT